MIDPRRLRVLRALADHGTVTAAARALYLTPSAVSQQLSALETEVGQSLLERRGRRVTLTGAGGLLAEHATAVLAQHFEQAESALAAHAAGAAGTITVGAFATAIAGVVAPAIAALAESNPEIEVRVRDAEGDASLALLLDGDIDLAVSVEYRGAPPAGDPRLCRVPLYAEPFDAVLPADHRLARDDDVALHDLAGDGWITPYPGNPCHDVVALACEYAGFTARDTHRSDDFGAVVALVAAGAGVALVPRSALAPVPAGSVVRPVAGTPPTRRVFAALRAGTEAHPLVTVTLDAIRRAAARQGSPARRAVR